MSTCVTIYIYKENKMIIQWCHGQHINVCIYIDPNTNELSFCFLYIHILLHTETVTI